MVGAWHKPNVTEKKARRKRSKVYYEKRRAQQALQEKRKRQLSLEEQREAQERQKNCHNLIAPMMFVWGCVVLCSSCFTSGGHNSALFNHTH
jgi:Flp pilus assembly protein TadB